MLQLTHCGRMDRGNGPEPKIYCEKIPKYNECTFFNDFAATQNYTSKNKQESETMQMIRKNYLGLEVQNRTFKPKVLCEQIPKFDDICVRLKDCPEALKLILHHRFDNEAFSIIKAASCGFFDQQEMVWCSKIQPLAKSIMFSQT